MQKALFIQSITLKTSSYQLLHYSTGISRLIFKKWAMLILLLAITVLGFGQNQAALLQTTEAMATSTEVGGTPGSLAVSLSGAATYTIPIAAPDGIGGLKPSVSLTYSSQSGNGVAGLGWSISGLSSITRLPCTLHHDGFIDPVDFDGNDRFALDGQRLIAKTGVYGADGTEYQTENFSTTRIFSYTNEYEVEEEDGNTTYGYYYTFKVLYPDGSVALFEDSYNKSTLNSIEYPLHTFTDSNNNRIRFLYSKINNVNYIGIIRYSYNSSTVYHSINFTYKARTKQDVMYMAGLELKQTQILDKITTSALGTNQRVYQMTYEKAQLDYERLTQFTEKNGDGTKSYDPIVFTYENSDVGIDASVKSVKTGLANITAQNTEALSGDFDGDGNIDVIYVSTAKNKYYVNLDIGRESLFDYAESDDKSFIDIHVTKFLDKNGVLSQKDGWVIRRESTNDTTYFETYELIHVMGYDIIYHVSTSKHVFRKAEYRPNCDRWAVDIVNKTYTYGDLTGDGLLDVLVSEGSTFYSYYECWPGAPPRLVTTELRYNDKYIIELYAKPNIHTYVGGGFEYLGGFQGDVNGDGKTDFLHFNHVARTLTVKTLNKDNRYFETLLTYTDERIQWIVEADDKLLIADFNGDGKTDFLIFDGWGNEYRKFISTGTGFVKFDENAKHVSDASEENKDERKVFGAVTETGGRGVNSDNFEIDLRDGDADYNHGDYSLFAMDVNNDGKADLVRYFSTYTSTIKNGNRFGDFRHFQVGYRVYLNTGTSFEYNKGYFAFSSMPFPDNYQVQRPFIPFIAPPNTYNPNLQFGILYDKYYYSFHSKVNLSKQGLLKNVQNGKSPFEAISYAPMLDHSFDENEELMLYEKTKDLKYPYGIIKNAPHSQLVSKIDRYFLQQTFEYKDAGANMQGLGFLGFREVRQSNFHQKMYDRPNGSDTPYRRYFNKTIVDLENRSLPIETAVEMGEYSNRDEESKNTIHYTITKNTEGVIRTLADSSVSEDFKTGVKTVAKATFDEYNNITSNTQKIYENGNWLKTKTTHTRYQNSPNGEGIGTDKLPINYHIGLPTSIQDSVYISTDTMTSQNYFEYNSRTNKLKKSTSTAPGVADVVEENIYDKYGNVTQKTITAGAMTPRSTRFAYSANGMFLMDSYNIEGQKTSFEYYTNHLFGLLKKQTNAFGQSTSYEYDTWGKQTKVTDYLSKSIVTTYEKINIVESFVGNSLEDLFRVFDYTTAVLGYKKIVTADDGKIGAEFIDGFGRKIYTISKDLLGKYTVLLHKYDFLGRNTANSAPFFSKEAAGGLPSKWHIDRDSPADLKWDKTVYQGDGKIASTTDFNGKTIENTYDKLKVTANDGTQTIELQTDGKGDMVSKTDEGGTINFTYFANGTQQKASYNGTDIVTEQDALGRKTKLTDPSAGTYTYSYDAYGQLTTETSPKGRTHTIYDAYGKATETTVKGDYTDTRTIFTYDPVSKLLTDINFRDELKGKTHHTHHDFDNQYRPFKSTETTPYATFVTELSYDGFGRVLTQTQKATLTRNQRSSTKTTTHTYQNGYLLKISDGAKTHWLPTTINERGQVQEGKLGNGIALTNQYDAYGFSKNVLHYYLQQRYVIMHLRYDFEPTRGNLNSRTNVFDRKESFTYDKLDRLTQIQEQAINGTGPIASQNQTYDSTGRIETNSELGKYLYDPIKRHQNVGLELNSKGAAYQSQNPDQYITYNAFKSPVSITVQGKERIDYEYNADQERTAMYYGSADADYNARPLRKYYSADGSIEILDNIVNNSTQILTYIGGDAYSAIAVQKNEWTSGSSTATIDDLYLHRDYQGSILVITNGNGDVLERRSFDAWGAIVKVTDGNGNILAKLTVLDRGYTGHEHLQGVGLIHMNGRLYDPALHRFLSPDNFVQDPYNTQNYNRYGYVLNNPLKYTDPSGELFAEIFSVVGFVVGAGPWGAALGYVLGAGLDAALNGKPIGTEMGKAIVIAAVSAGFASYVPGNIMSGFLYGAASGMTVNGIRNVMNGGGFFDNALTAGLVGGIMGAISTQIKNPKLQAALNRKKSSNWFDKNATAALGDPCPTFSEPTWLGDQFRKWGEKIASNLADLESVSKSAFGIALAAQKGGGETQGAFGAAIPIAATTAVVDGPIPIGDIIGAGVLAGAATYDLTQRKYITYTLTNGKGQTYVGRASGFGDPQSIMMNRFSGHHMRAYGYGNPQLDRVAQGYPVGYYAIRGREQDVVNGYGGIGSPMLGNSINPIWQYNPNRPLYMGTSNLLFGPYVR